MSDIAMIKGLGDALRGDQQSTCPLTNVVKAEDAAKSLADFAAENLAARVDYIESRVLEVKDGFCTAEYIVSVDGEEWAFRHEQTDDIVSVVNSALKPKMKKPVHCGFTINILKALSKYADERNGDCGIQGSPK